MVEKQLKSPPLSMARTNNESDLTRADFWSILVGSAVLFPGVANAFEGGVGGLGMC